MPFNGGTRARDEQMDRRFMFMKIFCAQGGCLSMSQDYIYVYDNYIQTHLKPLGQSKPKFMWSIVGIGSRDNMAA